MKMSISWSFSYNSFVKLFGKKVWEPQNWEPQHDHVVSKSISKSIL